MRLAQRAASQDCPTSTGSLSAPLPGLLDTDNWFGPAPDAMDLSGVEAILNDIEHRAGGALPYGFRDWLGRVLAELIEQDSPQESDNPELESLREEVAGWKGAADRVGDALSEASANLDCALRLAPEGADPDLAANIQQALHCIACAEEDL